MSRNVLVAIVVIVLVFLALLVFSQRGTNTQGGIVSPTPADQTVTVPPDAMEASPTTEITLPADVSPTVQVTVSPGTAQ